MVETIAKRKVYRRCNSKKKTGGSNRNTRSKSKSKSPSPETCPICLEPLDFKSRKNLFSGINCDHFFHKNCIKSWCKNNFDCNCPICRQFLFHTPATAQIRVNGLPPDLIQQSNAIVRNNNTTIRTSPYSPHSPDGPPPGVTQPRNS